MLDFLVMEMAEPTKEIRIEDLYPHFTKEQLKDAEERLDRYLELVLRMYERVTINPIEYEKFRRLVEESK